MWNCNHNINSNLWMWFWKQKYVKIMDTQKYDNISEGKYYLRKEIHWSNTYENKI